MCEEETVEPNRVQYSVPAAAAASLCSACRLLTAETLV